MSDQFEQAVRQAAHRLGEPSEVPSYEQAYWRGTVRLRRKRAAMGAVCALALVGGLMTGPFDGFGSTTVETDEVAIRSDAVPAPSALPAPAVTSSDLDFDRSADVAGAEQQPANTTWSEIASGSESGRGSRDGASGSSVPIPFGSTPTPTAEQSDDAVDAQAAAGQQDSSQATDPSPSATPSTPPEEPSSPSEATVTVTPTVTPTPAWASTPTATATSRPTPTATAVVAPTPTPTTAATSAPTPTPTAAPSPTATVAPTSTAVPTATVAPTATAVPTATVAPTATAVPTATVAPSPTATVASTASTADVPSPTPTEVGIAILPQLSPSILEDAAFDRPVSCDVDGDQVADGECQLQEPYRCSASTRVESDYRLADTDGDSVIDSCVPTTNVRCDTDFDGVGDTACIYTPE